MMSSRLSRNLHCRNGIRSVSSFAAAFNNAVASQPMREAVRYTGKNIKWTAADVKRYADAHANALLEHGFKGGDIIAVWLKESAEKHITFIALANIGAKIVDVDTSINSVAEVREFLSKSAAKAIFFDPVTETQDNLLLLRKSIPEFFEYDDSRGQYFHSKHFPSLKYFVHTGFDIEAGCLNYKSLFLPHPEKSEVDSVSQSLEDSTPVYSAIKKGPSGLTYSSEVAVGQLLTQPSWGYAKKLVDKQYFESL